MSKMLLLRLTATLAAFSCIAATPVRAQTGAPLSREDRALLDAIAACRTEPAPDYCAPFKLLLAHVRQADAPVPEAETTRHLPEMDADMAARRSIAVGNAASGLGSGLTGQIVPPDGGAALSLVAASDTKTASIALDLDLTGPSLPIFQDGTYRAKRKTLTITAQTPVGQDSDYQNIATLDGLTKATTIGLALNKFSIKWRSQAAVINGDDYQRRCVAIASAFLAADPNQKKTLESSFEPYGCNAGNLSAFVEADHDLGATRQAALLNTIAALRDSGVPKIESMRLISLNGKVGYQSHDYYDGVTLAKQSETRKPWQIGAAATQVFGGGRMSTTLSYSHQLTYDDGGETGQKQVRCPPSGSPNLECINGYVGAPTRTKKDLITLDYRYLAAKSPLGFPLGINPTATYDAASGVYGFQLPIYLVADSKKALTGGLRYDWTSDEHESVVGIFVTSAFCVLPSYSACSAKGEDK